MCFFRYKCMEIAILLLNSKSKYVHLIQQQLFHGWESFQDPMTGESTQCSPIDSTLKLCILLVYWVPNPAFAFLLPGNACWKPCTKGHPPKQFVSYPEYLNTVCRILLVYSWASFQFILLTYSYCYIGNNNCVVSTCVYPDPNKIFDYTSTQWVCIKLS